MDAPGISIFQGSESLEFGTNGQEDEEEEALEEEKKRNDELKDLISNAFDDLTDDDQSFANSSQPLSSHDTAERGESFDEDQHLEGIAHNLSSNYQVPLNKNDGKRRDYDPLHMNYDRGSDPRLFLPHKLNFNAGGDTNISALHYKHCAKSSPGFSDVQSSDIHCIQEDDNENISIDDDKYLKADYNSMEQLQVMYDVRVREIDRLHNEIEITKKHNKEMETQLKRRLALMEAEKERAVLSLKQSQNLLVNSKAQIGDLEKRIEQQTSKITELEESNFELTTQLDIAKASVADLQNRLKFLEKNDSSKRKELENDSYVRLIEERHRKEITTLQEEIHVAKTKLERKEDEFIALEKKIKEVTKSLENTVVDKTEVINRLVKNLEESQARCEQLMSSKLGQEIFELRMQLSGEKSEKKDLQEKINSLQKNIGMLQADVQNYESLTRFGLINSESVKDSDSMVQLGITGGGQSATRSVDPMTDLNVKLKEELKRSLIGQRMKREEIKRLQVELESKDLQIKEMQLQESNYMAEAEKFKSQTQQLLQHLRKEASTNAGDPKSRLSTSEKEMRVLKEQIKQYHDENKILISVKERLEKENSALSSENMKLLNQIEDISRMKEKEKTEAINRFQNEYLNFHDSALARLRAEKNEELEKEMSELRKQLTEAQKEAVEAKTTYLELLKDKDRKSDGSGLVNILKLQLAEERNAFAKFRENHENLVQQKCELLKSENANYIKEMEEKSRLLYAKKVNEEIENAKKETLKELENHYKIQIENKKKELEEEMSRKVDFEVSKVRKEMMKENVPTKDSDEKATELFKECCRLREELKNNQDDWHKEIERIKHEADKEKLEKLREQQRDIEERLGREFREQLKKVESTRDQAAKMLKEQLEAEQRAFLEEYEEKLHEYSMKVKSHSTKSTGTSPVNFDEMTDVKRDEVDGMLLKEKEETDEIVSKMIAEAVQKVILEEEAKYAGNLEVFRSLMEQKAQEVDRMRTAMATEQNRLKSALVEAKSAASEAELKTRRAYEDILKNKDTETKKLKEQIILLSKELEAVNARSSKEKNMLTQIMARWATEVQESKTRRVEEEKQLIQVYKKYKEIKKTVKEYKLSKEEQLKSEHRKLVDSFNQALKTIEERIKDGAQHDASQIQRIAAIEASFERKAEKLRCKTDGLSASEKVS